MVSVNSCAEYVWLSRPCNEGWSNACCHVSRPAWQPTELSVQLKRAEGSHEHGPDVFVVDLATEVADKGSSVCAALSHVIARLLLGDVCLQATFNCKGSLQVNMALNMRGCRICEKRQGLVP